jgi:hypothetical protein
MLGGNGLRVGGCVRFEGMVDAGVGQRDEWALTEALKKNLIELRQVAHGVSGEGKKLERGQVPRVLLHYY